MKNDTNFILNSTVSSNNIWIFKTKKLLSDLNSHQQAFATITGLKPPLTSWFLISNNGTRWVTRLHCSFWLINALTLIAKLFVRVNFSDSSELSSDEPVNWSSLSWKHTWWTDLFELGVFSGVSRLDVPLL